MKPRSQEIGNENMIGAKVVEIRTAKGISQGDFLVRLQNEGMDISRTSLSRLEGQHRLAKDIEVAVISRVLEADVRELFGLL